MKNECIIFNRKTPHGLTLILAGIVFLVITATMLISSLIFVTLYHMELLPLMPQPSYLRMIVAIAILSTIIATVLTLVLGHIPLRPIRELINATTELSKGNFDIRIDLNSPNELRELSDSFNKMAEELGSIELLRTDFINNFSHEFKTPIVSLKGFAKLLKDDNLSIEERNEYLDIIISESQRLSTLATNVLNLSKIENQRIITETKSFDLTESIRHSILLLETNWMKKDLQLDINLEEITYYANEELLNQVWLNLLDNAIKFTPEKGRIEINLVAFNDFITLKIKDSGCGMTSEVKKHIFDKFYQGDISHTIQGNGLGLTMVEKIIKLHKGYIEVKSQVNKGSIFIVSLPISIKNSEINSY